MTISLEQWRAAADHVKRIEELRGRLEQEIDIRIGATDIYDILHEKTVERIHQTIDQEIRRELANVTEELLERYGVQA